MTPEQFCYWLQGFSELNSCQPTDKQWASIKDHLALVFNKVTPAVATTGYVSEKSKMEEERLRIHKMRPNQPLLGTPQCDVSKTLVC